MDRTAGMWARVQRVLWHVEECLPPLREQHRRLIAVLEVVRLEEFVPAGALQWLGRRRCDRRALARAFVAKALLNLPHTKALVERLQLDRVLRQLCGWEQVRQVPSESTFSRAFAELAGRGLLDRVHAVRVKQYLGEEVVWHVARDATDSGAREKPPKKRKAAAPKHRPGRPCKGEVRPPTPEKRLVRQYAQGAAEAMAELPTRCDVGVKRDAPGHIHYWVGDKFHVDVGDEGLPLAALTTSASLHDSQAAMPLMKLTRERVVCLYELMDSAYDAALIRQLSQELGQVPIIDGKPRGTQPKPEMEPDRARRYRHRTQSERFNSDLKDNHGGRGVRVRGQAKVHAHLMCGLLVIFAEALLGLVT